MNGKLKDYKIPKTWKLTYLKNILSYKRLGGNYENSESYDGFPLIKMGNIGRGKININKIEYLSKNEIYNNMDLLFNGDLLFNTRNTLELVGKVAIWRGELKKAVYNSNLMKLEFKKEYIYSNFFMNYIFNSYYGLKQLRSFAIGTTSVAAIYDRDLEKFKVLVPPILEQKIIIEILTTWDTAIEKQEELIKLKNKQKKGLAEALLSGKVRIEKYVKSKKFKNTKIGEIPEDWEIRKFKDLTKVSQGLQIPIKNRFLENEKNRYFYITNQFLKKDSSEKYYIENPNKNVICTEEDILMTRTGNTGIVLSNVKGVFHNNFFKVSYNREKIIKDFLLYYLKYNKIQHLIMSYASSTTIPDLKHSDFYKIMISLPSLIEQKAIAQILSTADKEIELLEKELEYLKEQKKGLMQNLLTGKVRVKI